MAANIVLGSRCIRSGTLCPARSESVQEFFRSSPESSPLTYSTAFACGSERANLAPISSPDLRQRIGPLLHVCHANIIAHRQGLTRPHARNAVKTPKDDKIFATVVLTR
ncbi:hypothetical protein ABIB45_001667 [Arthrobacter sp. UYCo732]